MQYFLVWITASLFEKLKPCYFLNGKFAQRFTPKKFWTATSVFFFVSRWTRIIYETSTCTIYFKIYRTSQGWLWPVVAFALSLCAGWGGETPGCREQCPCFSCRTEQMEEVAEGFLGSSKGETERADDFKQAGHPETNQTSRPVGDGVSLSSQSWSLYEEGG